MAALPILKFVSGLLRPNLHIGVEIYIRPSHVNAGKQAIHQSKAYENSKTTMETTYAKYLLKVNSCIRIELATEKGLDKVSE